MTDRSVRNLANLRRSGSTARVLNLLKVWEEHGQTEDWARAPLFQTPRLNRGLILKHRLRRDELDNFHVHRHVATKVILPIDDKDLRAGGRFLFVDEIDFDRIMRQALGIGVGHPDRHMLELIAEMPSLDPFILREQLRRHGLHPAPCYFSVSPADMTSMDLFVQGQILPLVRLSVGDVQMDAVDSPIARLANLILCTTARDDLSVLGEALKLKPDQYDDAIFSWKGFLYYKWVLTSVSGKVRTVSDSVRTVTPYGRATSAQSSDIDRARQSLRRRMVETWDDAAALLRVYDLAFRRLTHDNDPTAFRDFLLDAPLLFARLGEQLGAVQHIVSFWAYRFEARRMPPDAAELLDLFGDFENSLPVSTRLKLPEVPTNATAPIAWSGGAIGTRAA